MTTAETRTANVCTRRDPELEAALKSFNDWKDGSAAGMDDSGDDTFTIATWNIQRIPFASVMNPSYRKDRLPCIMDVLGEFDIATVSERFLRAPNTRHPYQTDDNSRSQFRWLPLPNSDHHGLTLSSDIPFKDAKHGHYSACGPNKQDCRVKKGFVIVEVDTPNGTVVVVTSHMDAGQKPKDIAARIAQLEELSAALEPYADKPLILAGDFNFKRSVPEDDVYLQQFLKRHNLTLNVRQNVKGYDLIASRGLEVVNTLEYDASDLSDHPLLGVRFRYPPRESSAAADGMRAR